MFFGDCGGLGGTGANLAKKDQQGRPKVRGVPAVGGSCFDNFGEKEGIKKGVVLGTLFLRPKIAPRPPRRSIMEVWAPKKPRQCSPKLTLLGNFGKLSFCCSVKYVDHF